MTERGIDISSECPKPWTDEIAQAADVIVSMGCGDACPIFPGQRYLSPDFNVTNLASRDTHPPSAQIRDDIERRVRTLIDQLLESPNRSAPAEQSLPDRAGTCVFGERSICGTDAVPANRTRPVGQSRPVLFSWPWNRAPR